MNCVNATTVAHRCFATASICFFSLAIVGCATTIPRVDTVLPEIRLEISGPGIGRQIMSNPPRENWTDPETSRLLALAPNTEYRFMLTVSDRGGVARANIRMPDNFVVSDLTSGAIQEVSGISRSVTLTGSRADPLTGLILSGRFRTPDAEPANAILSFEFLTEGDDFGGGSGARNQRFMNVAASVNAL